MTDRITAHFVGGPKDGERMLVAPLADGSPPVSVVFEEDVPIQAEVEVSAPRVRVGRYTLTAKGRGAQRPTRYEWQGWAR